MTLNEFKAWFEGFTEDMGGAPSAAQFEKIKAKVAEINDTPISYPVFVERYRKYWDDIDRRPPWLQPYVSCSAGSVSVDGNSALSAAEVKDALADREVWDPGAAMYALGKAEYAA